MTRSRAGLPVCEPSQFDCSVRTALDVIKGRWKPSILYTLKDGARRFSEIQSALGTVSAQALTAQLKQLEADGIVARTIFQEVPVRVEYRMTDLGRTLAGAMDQLDAWGTAYVERRTRQESSST
jgi:DNA-binding HxlR family transcriptional regulator